MLLPIKVETYLLVICEEVRVARGRHALTRRWVTGTLMNGGTGARHSIAAQSPLKAQPDMDTVCSQGDVIGLQL